MQHKLTNFWLFLTASFTSLTLYLLFSSTPVSVREAQGISITPSPEAGQDIFFEDLVIQELPTRPLWAFDDLSAPSHSVFLFFDDTTRQVQAISGTDGALATLSYPPEYPGHPYAIQDVRSSEYPIYMECLVEGLFEINVEEGRFRLVEPVDCSPDHTLQFENTWSPDGRFYAYHVRIDSELFARETHVYDTWTHQVVSINEVAQVTTSWLSNWSPQWEYYVEFTRDLVGTLSECSGRTLNTNIVMYWRETGEARSVLCLDDWEAVEFETWLNDDDLLLRGYFPTDSAPKREEHFIIEGGWDYVDLGQNIKYETIFFDDGTKLVRIRIHNLVSEPHDCVLNIVDLETLISVDIQNMFCTQPASFVVDEPSQQLFYLRSDYSTEHYLEPELEMVHLKTFDVREIPIEDVREILSVSADGRYLALIADSSEGNLWTIYSYSGWLHPRLLIYDLEQNQIVYDHGHGQHFSPTVAWSPAVAAFTFNAGSEESPEEYLVTLDPMTEILLPKSSGLYLDWREDVHLRRSATWSPTGTQLLVFTDQQAQIIRLTDNTVIPVIRQLQTNEFTINVQWDELAEHLLVEQIPINERQTSGRWLIDPALATISYPLQDFGEYHP